MSGNAIKEQQSRRRFRLIAFYLVLLAPWVMKGALATLGPTANSPLDWVDADFEPRRAYDRFVEQFSAGDVVVISWPSCSVNDERLDKFTRSLRKSRVFFDGNQWYFHRVTSGREILRQFTSPPMSLTEAEARERLGTFLLGPDGDTTAILIAFNEHGLRNRGTLVPLIRAAAQFHGGADVETQHLAGPVIDGYEVDLASQATMSSFAPLSSLVVFCVCLLCLDSMYGAILVFGVACACQAVALSIVHYCGGTMTALLIVLPPLIQVLAVAGGIHLLNYYFDNFDGSPDEAIRTAVQIGWLPCVLSSATTAIGLGSLAVSGLEAVQQFGIFAAAGVIATLGALLVLIPGIIRWKPVMSSRLTNRNPWLMWGKLLHFQLRFSGTISFIGIATMIFAAWGLMNLQASVRIETMFSDSSRLIRDYAWIEKNVGPLVPIDVVVRFGGSIGCSASEKLKTLDKMKSLLLQEAGVQSVTSCLDFGPPSTTPLEGEYATYYLKAIQEPAGSGGYFRSDKGEEYWRLTAHMSALGKQDYGTTLKNLSDSLRDEFDAGDQTRSVKFELSGLMPLVHEIQRQLLHDLYSSFLTAFALIAVVMTIVQAGVVSGLIAMIPNVFPSLTLFGLLGWLDFPVDIGSIMTASIAMGIAVDDTLHFLNFYRRQLEDGATREHAVLLAYQHCGRAMIQTTVICCAGLSIFALSGFIPTARFAWMMVALLATALIGDLVLLPALLLNPLARRPAKQ